VFLYIELNISNWSSSEDVRYLNDHSSILCWKQRVYYLLY